MWARRWCYISAAWVTYQCCSDTTLVRHLHCSNCRVPVQHLCNTIAAPSASTLPGCAPIQAPSAHFGRELRTTLAPGCAPLGRPSPARPMRREGCESGPRRRRQRADGAPCPAARTRPSTTFRRRLGAPDAKACPRLSSDAAVMAFLNSAGGQCSPPNIGIRARISWVRWLRTTIPCAALVGAGKREVRHRRLSYRN